MLPGSNPNGPSFGAVYKAGNGEERKCYALPYRETMILVSGYSVELRSRIIDRWMALEAEKFGAIPKTFSAALQLAADQAKKIEEQANQLAIAAPKAAFFDAVTDSRDAIEMKDAAKALNIKGFGRNNLFEFLRDKAVLMQNNTPYQTFIDRGFFRVIEQKYETADGETHINLKTVVYQRGLDYMRKLIEKARTA